MKAFLVRFICRLLAVSLIALPYAPQTQAAMIGVDEALAAQRQAERGKLQGFLARADVQKQLATLGAANAADRVSALTDDEVQTLASRIDALPAGADISVAAALLIVLILVLLVFMMDRNRR